MRKIQFGIVCLGMACGWSLVGCSSDGGGDRSPDESGTLRQALHVGTSISPLDDVSGIVFEIQQVDCASGTPIGAPVVVSEDLADFQIPGGIPELQDAPLDKDSSHLFADAFVTAEPGCYNVSATPIQSSGDPSKMCRPAHKNGVVVTAGDTTEIFLLNQCAGTDPGALDAIAALNHEPEILDLEFEDSKFGTCNQPQVICATVTDPDHDPMELVWALGPGSPPATGPTVVSHTVTPTGAVRECVEFVPSAEGRYDVTLTVYDQLHSGGSLMRIEDWLASEGYPSESHAQLDTFFYSANCCSLTGRVGTEWETLREAGRRGLQAWVPSGQTQLYAGSGSQFSVFDLNTLTWAPLPAPPFPGLAAWGSPAVVDKVDASVWELRGESALRFDPTLLTWSLVRSDLHSGDDQAMTVTTDGRGNLWSYNSSGELVRYNTVTDTVAYFPTGIASSSFETRLGYDARTDSVFFGGFSAGNLYRFDIATSTVTQVAPHPEQFLNDIFCSDHCGHIYAAGDFQGTSMWQYDIASNTWSRIADLPADHGNNGSCSVVEDGWLYVEAFPSPDLYRIKLF